MKLRNLIAFVALTVIMSAFTPVQKAYDPSGNWSYEIETPDGTDSGKLVIAKEDGEYDATIESMGYGTLELTDVTFEKMVMEGTVEVAGGVADFELEFDGDSMEGVIYFGEDELPITAERDK